MSDNPAQPYSLRRTLAVGLGLAVGFALLSLFFLVLQAKGHDDRLAGEVIFVDAAAGQDQLILSNHRGEQTAVTLTRDAMFKGVEDLAEVSLGQHVMVRGTLDREGSETGRSFTATGLRIIEAPLPRD